MKKFKINFWHWFFYFGTFIEYLGDRIVCKGLDKLDDLTRDDQDAYMYQKKEVGFGNGPSLSVSTSWHVLFQPFWDIRIANYRHDSGGSIFR